VVEHFHGKKVAVGSNPTVGSVRNTKAIGDISEAKVLAAFISEGITVSIPFGENQRYDFIIDLNGVLSRVQVKSARRRGNAIIFSTATSHFHRGGEYETYRGQCDLFAAYCPETDEVFLVQVDDAPTRTMHLSIGGGVHKASDYLLRSVLYPARGSQQS
jgi:hypothetical protein